ncbi:MAG: hypothetical protein ACRD1B_02860 [Thermoanaerobaculia bacterium]
MNRFETFLLTAVLGAVVVASTADTASLHVNTRSVEELSSAVAATSSLSKAHRVIAFPDGSLLTLHHEPNTWERNAIGATLTRPDGKTKVFWAENFVPEGIGKDSRPAPRTVGQIYGGTLFPDGDTMAISLGWVDTQGKSHNAIGIRSLSKGLQNLIELDGTVRDLAAGPGNLLLAVVYLPGRMRAGEGSPLLIALDTKGVIHGEFFRLAPNADLHTIGDSVHKARVERIDDTHFSFYQDLESTVSSLEIGASADAVRASPTPKLVRWPVKASYSGAESVNLLVKNSIHLADPEIATKSAGLTTAVHTDKDGSVTVVRSYSQPRPHTTVLQYRSGETDPKVWSPATPWRAAYWMGDILVGVANQGDATVLESVKFQN